MSELNKRIYLDNAATTPVRPEVVEAINSHFTENYGNPSSIYRSGRNAAKYLDDYRTQIANVINADKDEIFFVSCGTEADNWAVKGIAKANINKGKHIITSSIEHHAVLNACKALGKEGWEVTYLSVDHDGMIDLDELERSIRPDTVLVSIMFANNEIGTIQPVKKIAEICKRNNVPFHTDAVQALGAVKIDVKALDIDSASFSGHKIYAPKGIGFIYIRKGVRINPLLNGGAQEKGKRPGTENLPYIAGLATAVRLAGDELEKNNAILVKMRDEFIDKVLERIPHTRLNGSLTNRLPGNANISFEFIEGESLLLLLDSKGYECSSGSACTSGSLDPSHVLLAIGLPHEIAHGSLRVTFGKDTDPAIVEDLVEDLKIIVKRLRDMSPLYEDFLKGRITEPNCMLSGESSYCRATTGCIKKDDRRKTDV